MNINAQRLDSAYIPFQGASASAINAGASSGAANGFAELLEKAGAARNASAAGMDFRPSGKGEAESSIPIDKTGKLYEMCAELETFLIKNLIKGMRNTVQKTKLIDTGFAGEVYEDMLYDEYAKAYSKNANFGFAEMAYRELSGMR